MRCLNERSPIAVLSMKHALAELAPVTDRTRSFVSASEIRQMVLAQEQGTLEKS